MAYQILICPDALRDAASKLRSVNLTAPDELTAASAELQDCWEGAGAMSCVDALREMAKICQELEEEALTASEQISQNADSFEALDNGAQGLPIRIAPLRMLNAAAVAGKLFDFAPTGQIRVVPESVRAVAARCKAAADNIRDFGSNYNSVVNSLGSSWQGNAYSKFAEGAEELYNATKTIAEATDNLVEKLRYAAERYEEADQSVAGR